MSTAGLVIEREELADEVAGVFHKLARDACTELRSSTVDIRR